MGFSRTPGETGLRRARPRPPPPRPGTAAGAHRGPPAALPGQEAPASSDRALRPSPRRGADPGSSPQPRGAPARPPLPPGGQPAPRAFLAPAPHAGPAATAPGPAAAA